MRRYRYAQERTPGTMSAKLERRMGDRAELFNDIGQKFYSTAVLSLKDTLTSLFEQQLNQLSDQVREEFGRRGLEESAPHFNAWMNELVGDLVQFGMEDVSGAVEDLANSIAAEYVQESEQTDVGEAEEELFEVSPDEVEEVEEVPEEEVEPAEEGEEAAPAEGEGDEGTLEDLFAEGARPDARRPRRKARRPSRRQVSARRRGDRRASTVPPRGRTVRKSATPSARKASSERRRIQAKARKIIRDLRKDR